MSQQNMNYEQFQKMPLSMRRTTLNMAAGWGGADMNPLFMAVYDHETEPELRELAKKQLEAHQIRTPSEPNGNYAYVPPAGGREIEFTGGDGRYKTIEQLRYTDKLLLTNPRNQAYLEGEKAAPNSGGYRILALIGVFTLVTMGGLIVSRTSVALLAWVVLVVLSSAMFFFAYRSYQNDQKFAAEGKLLQGQVIAAFKVRSTKTVNGQTRARWSVRVAFVVRKPDDTKLYGSQELAQSGLATEEPPVGTPIALLYISDQEYRVL